MPTLSAAFLFLLSCSCGDGGWVGSGPSSLWCQVAPKTCRPDPTFLCIMFFIKMGKRTVFPPHIWEEGLDEALLSPSVCCSGLVWFSLLWSDLVWSGLPTKKKRLLFVPCDLVFTPPDPQSQTCFLGCVAVASVSRDGGRAAGGGSCGLALSLPASPPGERRRVSEGGGAVPE